MDSRPALITVLISIAVIALVAFLVLERTDQPEVTQPERVERDRPIPPDPLPVIPQEDTTAEQVKEEPPMAVAVREGVILYRTSPLGVIRV